MGHGGPGIGFDEELMEVGGFLKSGSRDDIKNNKQGPNFDDLKIL